MYFCRHCLSLFLSTIQWVWLLDFVSYKIHIFICSRIFKLIFVWLYFNKITKLSRVEFQSSTWSSYQPNNDLSCICCCFTKNGNKSWSTKQKKKLCGYIWRHCFESPVALHDANEKRVQCAVFDLWPIYQNVFIPLQRQIVRVKNCWSFTNDSKVVFVA